jgi:hypothetical protein
MAWLWYDMMLSGIAVCAFDISVISILHGFVDSHEIRP